MNAPGKFKILSHANGTKTLVDEENAQAMHSRIGPEQEAHLVYADRARLETRLRKPSDALVLYDVGMGTAANVIAVFDRLRAQVRACGLLRVFSFETKPEGLRVALANLADFPILAAWPNELRSLLENGKIEFTLGEVRIEWTLLTGDFYAALAPDSLPPPDVLFFDFYSPKVVPEVWTREKFALLRRKIGEHTACLYTYSAATPVRLNLLLAGFFVGSGISTDIKNETTIAATKLELLEAPLEKKWLAKLETSVSIANAPGKDEVRQHPQWSR